MRILRPSPYRKIFLFGLVVFVITAWFSAGYNHPDEHFQVLEYCNYKMGLSSPLELPWEFSALCRTSIQPFIAYCLCKSLMTAGFNNPFFAAFLLRLLSGLLAWWVICRLALQLLPGFSTTKGKKIFVYCSFFLWFVPYLSVRFSSENIAGLLFFLSVSLILEAKDMSGQRSLSNLMFAGLLLGFMLFVRLQMAFALLGVCIWLLFIYKLKRQNWLAMILAGSAAIVICVVIDHWFYGTWMFTPYNYFKTNIIQHVAEKWGVYPWYDYFIMFIQVAIPPLSLVLLPLFFYGIWKKPLNVFSLLSITFLIGHFMIGHKEMRFLYPIAFAFIYLACSGLDALILKYPFKPIYKLVFNLLLFVNVSVILFRMLEPAQEALPYFNFLYNYSQKHSSTLIYFVKSPYNISDVEINFYKSKNLLLQCFDDEKELSDFIENYSGERPVFYLSHEIKPEAHFSTLRLEKIFCVFPDWLLKYNINDWQDRSHIWTLYKVLPGNLN